MTTSREQGSTRPAKPTIGYRLRDVAVNVLDRLFREDHPSRWIGRRRISN